MSLQEDYNNSLKKKEEQILAENDLLIRRFIKYCKNKNIHLTIDNFSYQPRIGILANYPDIIGLLNDNIQDDKEGLISTDTLEENFTRKPSIPGCYFSEEYMMIAHPYFRRSYYEHNNFSPHFIARFWQYESKNIKKYISLDRNRVRINVDNSVYMEFDTWYGPRFKYDISEIGDGIAKLRPPIDLDTSSINFIFGDVYSLDIMWNSKENIRIFQAEEFKNDNIRIIKDNTEYYPVRYVHAEFDTGLGKIRHFDGAIHFYTEDEYYSRRDTDFNHNNKCSIHQKVLSQKLFKINGEVGVNDWIDFVGHYFTGNPLVFEYFEGNFPQEITEIIDKLRRQNNPK